MIKKKRTIYVKLRQRSGKITTKKIRVAAKGLKGVQTEYLGTAEHFRTEAYPIAIVKKPKGKRIVKRRDILGGYSKDYTKIFS